MYKLIASVQDIWVKLPQDAREWLARNYTTGLRIGIVLMAASLLNKYSGRFMKRALNHALRPELYPNKIDRERRLNTLSSLVMAITHFSVWVIAMIVIIGLLGINAGPIFASAGLIGAGIAFGAQSLIKDFLSGVFIISENQYRIGDFVELMGVSGTVQTIGLRSTVLRDLNGSVHHIPNGSVVVSTNKTMGYGQINLDIIVAPDTDIALLQHVINHAGERLVHKTALKDEILDPPHFSRVSEYTGNGITVKVTGKTAGGKQLEVKSALLLELKKAFDEHQIKVAVLPGTTNFAVAKKKK